MVEIESALAPLFQELSDGVCAADAQGRVLYLNRNAEKLLGLPMTKASGRSLCGLLCARLKAPGLGECASKCALRDPNSAAKSVTFTGRYSQEPYYRWQDAGIQRAERQRDLRVMCLRMPQDPLEPSGQEKHFVIIEDVSAEMELERQREDWRSMVAHDLRVPLANVFGALRTIEEEGAASGLNTDDFEMIQIGVRSCHRMMELIDLYLDVARLDAGMMLVEPAPLAAAPLVRACVEEQAPVSSQKRIEVAVDVAEDLRVLADPHLLSRAVHNVLNNALKFAPIGGHVKIAAARAPEGHVKLTIEDDGPGISPDEIPGLFDRYRQARLRQGGKRSGTGLGLAFCRQALEAMDGAITVDSPREGGAVFTIRLPEARPAAAPKEPDPSRSAGDL